MFVGATTPPLLPPPESLPGAGVAPGLSLSPLSGGDEFDFPLLSPCLEVPSVPDELLPSRPAVLPSSAAGSVKKGDNGSLDEPGLPGLEALFPCPASAVNLESVSEKTALDEPLSSIRVEGLFF